MAFWKKPVLPAINEIPSKDEQTEPTIITADVAVPKTEDQRLNSLRSALSEGTVIQGKLSFDTPVRIDGKLNGQVFSTDALYVGAKGEIQAEIEVAELIVKGCVKGNVKAWRRVEIHAGGSVSGKIQTPVLVLQEGGMLDADVSMKTELSAETQGSATNRDSASESQAFDSSEEARLH